MTALRHQFSEYLQAQGMSTRTTAFYTHLTMIATSKACETIDTLIQDL